MSLAALEINDVALTLRRPGGSLHRQPGWVAAGEGRLLCGEGAGARWAEAPHAVWDRHWEQLGDSPVVLPDGRRRSAADLAYAQLEQLFAAAGGAAECLVAVPGDWQAERIGRLFGLLEALGVRPRLAVEAALACAFAAGAGTCAVVECHRHRLLATAVTARAGRLVAGERWVSPGLGRARLERRLAEELARRAVAASRFDPLRDPRAAAQLYRDLPAWLAALERGGEVAGELATPAGPLAVRLDAEALARPFAGELGRLQRWLAGSDRPVVWHATAAPLAGLLPALAGGQVLAPGAAVDALLALAESLPGAEAPARLHALPAPRAAPAPDHPLHLLCGHRAWPLDAPLSLFVEGGRVWAQPGSALEAVAVLRQRGGELEVLRGPVRPPPRLEPGATVEVAGIPLTLIEVAGG
ncbi:MAG: hypothetical protein KatS3mg124_0574 [Porticoccaceae bacterium]|nr:MAG: hypothetical protein KatS3mg124_0574 [Porticoccaceae bacterium]